MKKKELINKAKKIKKHLVKIEKDLFYFLNDTRCSLSNIKSNINSLKCKKTGERVRRFYYMDINIEREYTKALGFQKAIRKIKKVYDWKVREAERCSECIRAGKTNPICKKLEEKTK